MADYNEIKDTVFNALGTAADLTRGLVGRAADKTKDVAKLAKLNMELNSEKEIVQKAYLEMGKLYYETHKNAPEGFFVQLCDEINLANQHISKLTAEIDALKSGVTGKDSNISVEYTEIKSESETKTATDEDFVPEEPQSEQSVSEEPTSEEPKSEE
ncbi:MAG: hypothetical protein ACOX66_09115 [Oscillospiraceae bacterium]|jgi:hypothetical protein